MVALSTRQDFLSLGISAMGSPCVGGICHALGLRADENTTVAALGELLKDTRYPSNYS